MTSAEEPIGAVGPIRVSHIGADRAWAEWIAQQLGNAGRMAEPTVLDQTPDDDLAEVLRGELRDVPVLVVVATDSYFRVGGRTSAEWTVALRELGPLFERLIFVAVTNVNLPPFPRPRIVANLSRLDEQGARTELLRSVLGEVPVGVQMSMGGELRARVRFPADEPAAWGREIPRRNIHFVGRDELLLDLRERLNSGALRNAPCVLFGLGGVGKTQIAVEYAYRFATDYDAVWWLRAETASSAAHDMARLAHDVHVRSSYDEGDMVRGVLNALRKGKPYQNWLIIFDNAGSPEELRHLLPSGGGHVLITSRMQEWEASANLVELDVYQRWESVRFLRRRVRGMAEADAGRLAEFLGDLPLALEAAAAWMVATRMPVNEYLDVARLRLSDTFDDAPVATYENMVSMAWAPSMNQLKMENLAAAQLLRICAFLSGEPIPMTLFAGPHGESHPPVELPSPLHHDVCNPQARGRMLRDIGKYALARVGYISTADGLETETVQMHRVVQQISQELLPSGERDSYRRLAQRLVAAADPGQPDIQSSWTQYANLYLHIDPAGLTSANVDQPVRRFMLNEVRYLFMRGDFAGCKSLAVRMRADWSQVLSERESDMVLLNGHLANVMRGLGEYREALPLEEANLSVIRALGPNRLEALMAANGLAATLRRLGEWRRGYELDEDTLNRARTTYGDDHPRTLMAANNFAVSLRLLGRFAQALALDEDTVERRRRLFEPRHPHTLLAVNNVARDLREVGRYSESVTMQERTYEWYRELYGKEHPDSLRAMKNLAVSRRKAGQYAQALELARESRALHREQFGPDHPETVAATTNFANDLRLNGDHVEALAMALEALEISTRAAGESNPYTLVAATNAAVLHRREGNLMAAYELDKRTAAALQDKLGDGHPYVLTCLINQASDLVELGDPAQAVSIGASTHAELVHARGPNHPYTLACAINLAADLRATAADEAERLRQRTLEAYASVLGVDHPEVRAARDGARIDCDSEPTPT